MKRIVPFLAAALALTLGPGCHLFRRKPKPPKVDKAIATQVEKEFEDRWVAKRVADLTAHGVNPDAARAQAIREFREKYSYTGLAQHP